MHMAMDQDMKPLDIGMVHPLEGQVSEIFLSPCRSLLQVPSQLDL